MDLDELQKKREQMPAFWRERISPLTKAFQVEGPSDLDYLIWSFFPDTFLKGIASFADEHKTDSNPTPWEKIDMKGYLQETRESVRDSCAITKKILTDHCHLNAVRWGDIKTLDKLLVQYATVEIIGADPEAEGVFVFRPEMKPDDHYFPTELLRSVVVPEKNYRAVAAEILQDLKKLMLDNGRVARCKECKSVFVQSRQGASYCSERCSHRAAERRRRLQKVFRKMTANLPSDSVK